MGHSPARVRLAPEGPGGQSRDPHGCRGPPARPAHPRAVAARRYEECRMSRERRPVDGPAGPPCPGEGPFLRSCPYELHRQGPGPDAHRLVRPVRIPHRVRIIEVTDTRLTVQTQALSDPVYAEHSLVEGNEWTAGEDGTGTSLSNCEPIRAIRPFRRLIRLSPSTEIRTISWPSVSLSPPSRNGFSGAIALVEARAHLVVVFSPFRTRSSMRIDNRIRPWSSFVRGFSSNV